MQSCGFGQYVAYSLGAWPFFLFLVLDGSVDLIRIETIAFTQNLCKTVGVELNIPALNSTTAIGSEAPTSATASAAATKAKGEENAATVFGAPMWGAGGLMGTVGAVVVVLTWYDTI